MRAVVATVSLLAALALGQTPAAMAQEPPPPPPPPAQEPPPPPPARETAVPRAERAREAAERVVVRESEQIARPAREAAPAERAGSVRRDDAPRDAAPGNARSADEGSRRRAPTTANETRASSPATAPVSTDDGQRPGAVRRPPADGPGSGASRDRAVVRTSPPRNPDHDYDRIYVYPDYWSYGRYYDPYYYGFHLGYLAYSPWGWMPAFYGYPYAYGYGYQPPTGWDVGGVKLKVKQRDAEVYVDGYFAGHVDDFDGMFQSLRLDSGAYRIEIRKPGFETLTFDVRVQPDRTITYRGEMRVVP